jgi:hypothetical protein
MSTPVTDNLGIPVTPPANYANASPQIVVEIYPQSGGTYTFNGGAAGILQATIHKNIHTTNGEFNLLVAPGGPNGVSDPNSWASIINPNSLCIISLSRGGSQRTVMVGVVTGIEEDQAWSNNKVIRGIRITGVDFSYYFTTFSLYTLSFLGLLSTALPQGAAGYLVNLYSQMLTGSPSQVANEYLTEVMLGMGNQAKPGVLQNTYLFYKGNQFFLYQLFSSWIQTFPALIPFMGDLMNSEGTWMDKFLSFLPFPFYEFFITTAESKDYAALGTPPSGDYVTTAASAFTTQGYNTVSPTVIGRILPFPWVEYPATPVTSSNTATLSPGSTASPSIPATVPILHNYDVWNKLPIFSLGEFSFIQSQVKYDTDEVCNFLAIQLEDTNQIANGYGLSPTMVSMEVLGAIVDKYSINTFGYRANFKDIRWLTWASPSVLPIGNLPFNPQMTSNLLLGMLASYYIPLGQMLQGQCTFPMWPDVLPGNRFEYLPFKNQIPYLFYIEGVTHNYSFGGSCTTRVEISRGLQATEYNDPNLLADLLMDVVIRKDGQLVTRLDLANNKPAFHVTPAAVQATIAKQTFPWGGPAPVVNPPPVNNTAYDSNFRNAANNASCSGLPGAPAGSPSLANILKGIAYTESSFRPGITGPANSNGSVDYGLMQINSNTLASLQSKGLYTNVNTDPVPAGTVAPANSIFNPDTNLAIAAHIFCSGYNSSAPNPIPQAVATYNTGNPTYTAGTLGGHYAYKVGINTGAFPPL